MTNMKGLFKRYCKILTLKNDHQLIKEYKEVHGINKAWPEVTEGMRKVGILDMEIYIYDNILFMIMDTVKYFDHERDMARLALEPRQKEWESLVSRFQNSGPDETAGGKWKLMERIYEMDQKKDYNATSGQLKKLH